VREVARRDKDARFTALLHHVSLGRLRAAYWAIRPQAAPGVDGVTWAEYGQDLEVNLQDLHARVQSGRYRAKPSRRVYIPKADGRQRPLGIATVASYCLFCCGGWGCGGGFEVDGSGDALLAGGLDLVVPGHADPAGGGAADFEVGVGDPAVDGVGADTQPGGDLFDGEFAVVLWFWDGNLVGVADPLHGVDVEYSTGSGGVSGGVQ
jgi:hypothetical protein